MPKLAGGVVTMGVEWSAIAPDRRFSAQGR